MTPYSDIWFKYQVWGMRICLGVFALYTLILLIKLVMILLADKKEGKK